MLTVNEPIKDELIKVIPLFCKIYPLARPRLNTYTKTIYQPLQTQKELRTLISHFKPEEPINEPIIVDVTINFATPIKAKFDHPQTKNYGDEDNLRKAILDALVINKIIADDALVLGGTTYKAFAKAETTIINIYKVKEKPTEREYVVV